MWHYDRRRDLDLDHYDANFTCVHSGIFLPGMAASADRGIRLPYVTSLRVSLRLCPELVRRPCSHVVYVCAIVNRAEYVRRVPRPTTVDSVYRRSVRVIFIQGVRRAEIHSYTL